MMRLKKRVACGLAASFTAATALLLWNNDVVRRTMPLIQPPDMDISCYDQLSEKASLPRFDVYKEQSRLSSGKNIFFHETSCFGEGPSRLNCRQACAVESAARMNPGMSVNLLFLSPSPPSNRTARLVGQLLTYENVRASRVRVAEYIRDTPLECWYNGGVLRQSYWPTSHMSDIMRYLTLWKYGGIYLDLDVVVTKSLEDLTNFAGAEDYLDVAAGVIGFTADGFGHRVANSCLRDLIRNFRGHIWGNNGPGVITRTLQKYCVVQYASDMTPERCNGFQVFPPSAFYPIYYKEWMRYFSRQNLNETMQLISKARAIHVWNKLSKSEVIRVGSQVPYELVAQKHCPRVYSNCGPTF